MAKLSKEFRVITCARCGKQDLRKGNFVKYCQSCSLAMSQQRKDEYGERNRDKNNARARDHAAKVAPRNKAAIRAAGLALSETKSLSDLAPPREYAWIVRFHVPFSNAASKNHIYSMGHHVFKRTETRDYQDMLALATKSAMQGRQVARNKLWIGLHVEKPHHKGDAVNVVDAVCDAIKGVVGLDDRWFCIDFLDWSISKNEPRLIIQIAQEVGAVDSQACSMCGHIRPLTDFGFHRSHATGRHRICSDCKAEGKRIAKTIEPEVSDSRASVKKRAA